MQKKRKITKKFSYSYLICRAIESNGGMANVSMICNYATSMFPKIFKMENSKTWISNIRQTLSRDPSFIKIHIKGKQSFWSYKNKNELYKELKLLNKCLFSETEEYFPGIQNRKSQVFEKFYSTENKKFTGSLNNRKFTGSLNNKKSKKNMNEKNSDGKIDCLKENMYNFNTNTLGHGNFAIYNNCLWNKHKTKEINNISYNYSNLLKKKDCNYWFSSDAEDDDTGDDEYDRLWFQITRVTKKERNNINTRLFFGFE